MYTFWEIQIIVISVTVTTNVEGNMQVNQVTVVRNRFWCSIAQQGDSN
jgi:hypothetical protein